MLINPTNENTGDMLRHWRKVRRMSQMDLALAANVSTRHLSFVETGRSRPSDDLILRLGEVMDLPLRHVNTILVAAGYAPQYTQWTLDDDETGMIRAALEHILAQHAPYPAVVINREYDILLANAGFIAAVTWLTDDANIIDRYSNLFRLMFADDGLWQYFVDWGNACDTLLKRLHEESLIYQSQALADLYEECITLRKPPAAVSDASLAAHLPVLTFAFCKDGLELQYFSTMTTFGTAIDVTLQELRIESMFPADEPTRRFFQARSSR